MASPGQNFDLSPEMENISAQVDAQFDHLLKIPGDPSDILYEAMRYAAIGGGKRLRPALVVGTARLFHVDEICAVKTGTAIEALHVYSLIHDDLPCMDDDDLRRGKPTVHRKFDEATAILAGDALHALSFDILCSDQIHSDPMVRSELVACLAKAAGPEGMAGGQIMDLEAEKSRFDLPTVTRLQQLKTGALMSACVEMGSILGKVPVQGRSKLRGFINNVGLAFQIADDILDVEGDPEKAGKQLQKDERAGKQTFLTLMGLERAKEQAHILVDQAKVQLSSYGKEADMLRAIADYTIERDW